MLGELSKDVMGSTNPIIDHSWLTVNTQTYDNYPSDNNAVRVLPKLSEMWNHGQNTGLNLVPNMTVQSTAAKKATEVSAEVIRECKKAMMSGLYGKDLAEHMRARFSKDSLASAGEDIKKLSSEQGLLGNVYIDASAFVSGNEMEQFLMQHRNRLAQDIVVNESKLNSSVISVLASKFHKNVVASVNYDASLLQKYKNHLVTAGRIDNGYAINSKEDLRVAFTNPVKTQIVAPKKAAKAMNLEAMKEDMVLRAATQDSFVKTAQEEMTFRKISPILDCAREQFSKGKTGGDLKEILRKKYASEDLRDSVRYLGLVASDKLSSENVDALVAKGKISDYVADMLKRLAKKYPVKQAMFEEQERVPRTVGVQAKLYALSGKKDQSVSTEHKEAALADLRKGLTPEAAMANLAGKISAGDAEKVLASAVREFNAAPAGTKANVFIPASKEKVVADLKEKQTLPDPETIIPKTQEIVGFFEGASMDIELNGDTKEAGSLEVGDMFNRSGLDSVL